MVLSVELHFDLKIGCLGNWVRRYGFVFIVLRKQGIVSINVIKQSRKTVKFTFYLYLHKYFYSISVFTQQSCHIDA